VTEQTQPGGQPPRTASEILSAAETLAEEIRGRAHADADAIRARAGSESDVARATLADRVQRLSALAEGMGERLGEMRVELDALAASMAGGGAAVAEPRSSAGAVPDSAVRESPVPEPAVPESPVPESAVPESAVPESPVPESAVPESPVPESPVPESAVPESPVPEPAVPELPAAEVDDAGARLIALNLALSDTPRDEAARQLRDHQVPDPERLVDEVYASVDR
jgi:hypothetical protein